MGANKIKHFPLQNYLRKFMGLHKLLLILLQDLMVDKRPVRKSSIFTFLLCYDRWFSIIVLVTNFTSMLCVVVGIRLERPFKVKSTS